MAGRFGSGVEASVIRVRNRCNPRLYPMFFVEPLD